MIRPIRPIATGVRRESIPAETIMGLAARTDPRISGASSGKCCRARQPLQDSLAIRPEPLHELVMPEAIGAANRSERFALNH